MSQENNNVSENNNPSANRDMNQERFDGLRKLIGEQETRIQAVLASAFQLANFYFVFQGVVFAAISNSPSLTCSDSWFVFTLSALAASLNLFALFAIGSKYIRAMNLHDKTWSEYNRYLTAFSSRKINQTNGGAHATTLEFTGEFSPGNDHNGGTNDDEDGSAQNWVDPFPRWWRYVALAACMVLFLAFTGVMLSSPWTVVCKHDKHRRRNIHRAGFQDCFELCNASKCMSFCHR